MRPANKWMAATAVLLAAAQAGSAQTPADSTPRAAFKGVVASIRTTQPVPMADVRLMWVDSVHTDKVHPEQPGDIFVDSARSRIAITDSSGTFTVRNLEPGHYLINVRRIGFSPFEGMLTMDTHPVEMELALEQVMTILPPVRITAGSVNKVTQRLDRVGFVSRSNMGFGARFMDRQHIMDSKAQYLTQVLERFGLSRSDTFMIDNIMTDWDELRDYPLDLVVGIEVYPRKEMLPVEFSITRQGRQTFTNDRGTPIKHAFVVLWTFIP